METIPAMKEFLYIFPAELTTLTPEREVNFDIELIPGVAPIFRTPYRMAQEELKELKDQLQELLQQGYICPSIYLHLSLLSQLYIPPQVDIPLIG